MSDTATTTENAWPTPAADKLAAETPRLQAEINAYKAERTSYWDQGFTIAQLHDVFEPLGVRRVAKGTAKDTLVAVLVDEYDLKKNDDRTPALAELADLQREAGVETSILDMLRKASTLQQVDERWRTYLAQQLAKASPEGVVDIATDWQFERAEAKLWHYLAFRIRDGLTPIEAAQDSLQHGTFDLVSDARGAHLSSGNPIREMLNRYSTAATAKTLDSLALVTVLSR